MYIYSHLRVPLFIYTIIFFSLYKSYFPILVQFVIFLIIHHFNSCCLSLSKYNFITFYFKLLIQLKVLQFNALTITYHMSHIASKQFHQISYFNIFSTQLTKEIISIKTKSTYNYNYKSNNCEQISIKNN